MRQSTVPPVILVFDSGLGGLTVLREIAALRPDVGLVYVADDAAFPYGAWPERDLAAHVTGLMARLIAARRPDLVVIACNTASTLVLAELRRLFALPFVGTVPAIKPACASSRSRLVTVLGTEATVKREYTQKLIRDFGQGCAVTLVGSKQLAVYAEAELRGEPVSDAAIAAEIEPCFVRADGARTDTIVLACTHYPLLRERLIKASPWPATFVDPAPAIARRVIELIGPVQTNSVPVPAQIQFTSGQAPLPALSAALEGFGFRANRIAAK